VELPATGHRHGAFATPIAGVFSVHRDNVSSVLALGAQDNREARFEQAMPAQLGVIRAESEHCSAEHRQVSALIAERSAFDVFNHIRHACGIQHFARLRDQVRMLPGIPHLSKRSKRLTRRRRPDEIELPQIERRTQRISLHERIPAVPRLPLMIDAGYMEPGHLKATSGAACS
jgi:hypothetical protein